MTPIRAISAAFAAVALLAAFQGAKKPEEEFSALIQAFLDKKANTMWDALDKLPGVKWSATPQRELSSCMADGNCYARQGAATIGGKNVAIIAAGARSIVMSLYARSAVGTIGDAALLQAFKGDSITTTLSRCPSQGSTGGTNWYKLEGANLGPGFLSIQTSCAGQKCEGFVASRGERLPKLATSQVALYSESCGAGAERKAVAAAGKPHEVLAETIKVLISGAATGLDWAGLAALPTGITWSAGGPKPMDLKILKNDPNPMGLTGSVTLSGRDFSLFASGTATQVKNIYLDEGGMHPKGEHMLGVLYTKGFQIQLVRCGPVYTESTNNWYTANSAKTKPAMILQSIRYEGNNVQDGYAIRLDGTLPARDSRDRNPGQNGC